MAVLAIAGGTGGVGKTIVEQLQLPGSHHKFFILSRKVPTETPPGSPEFLKADYGNVESLAKTLEDNQIDTVISTINLETEPGSQAQLALIAAADKCPVTRRFIPSEFVSMIDDDDPNAGPGIGGWIPNARALKKTSLEYIRISIGFFSDYWGMPHIKSNLKKFRWFLDMERGTAVVPGSGDERFTVTYSEDLARVIVRLLDDDEAWPERGFVSGSDISINELIASAEKIRGSKIDVIHNSVEDLENGKATLLWAPDDVPEEEFKGLMAGLCQMIIAGACVLPQDERRLDRRFPELRFTTAHEILARAWGNERGE